MTQTQKKKSRGFSLNEDEHRAILARAKEHGFRDKNEYLLALYEADLFLDLEVVREQRRNVLRPANPRSDIERELDARRRDDRLDAGLYVQKDTRDPTLNEPSIDEMAQAEQDKKPRPKGG
jgi:hypothetical protein